jgi:hypothetical protein
VNVILTSCRRPRHRRYVVRRSAFRVSRSAAFGRNSEAPQCALELGISSREALKSRSTDRGAFSSSKTKRWPPGAIAAAVLASDSDNGQTGTLQVLAFFVLGYVVVFWGLEARSEDMPPPPLSPLVIVLPSFFNTASYLKIPRSRFTEHEWGPCRLSVCWRSGAITRVGKFVTNAEPKLGSLLLSSVFPQAHTNMHVIETHFSFM